MDCDCECDCNFALAFALALTTTKARAVLSVHSSSRVNNLCLVTRSDANDDDAGCHWVVTSENPVIAALLVLAVVVSLPTAPAVAVVVAVVAVAVAADAVVVVVVVATSEGRSLWSLAPSMAFVICDPISSSFVPVSLPGSNRNSAVVICIDSIRFDSI